jgi:hypothetical protein
MNRSRKIALLTVCGLAFAGAAFGDILNETCAGTGASAVDFGPPAGPSGDISCVQFNVAGATLNSITITINGTDTGSIEITNNNATPDTSATGTILTSYSLDTALAGFGFGGSLFNITMSVGPAPIAVGDTIGNNALAGANSAGPLVDSDSTTFVPYSGAGNFDIFVDTGSSSSLFVSPSGNGNNTFVESDTVSAGATVSFDFTPGGTAPEPGTALLLGIGTVFVLFGSRRRRKA